MSAIAYFAPDWRDPAVRRRVEGLRANGYDVVTVAFERGRLSSSSRPDGEIVDLGAGDHALSARRVLHLGRGLWRAVRASGRLDESSAILARNLDMAVLALLVRSLMRLRTRTRVPLIYEILDVRQVAISPGAKGRAVRFVERRVLDRAAAVVVSSPGFVDRYLRPLQGYQGPCHVVENRLASPPQPERPARRADLVAPVRLVWAGSLRCVDSLRILDAATRRLDGRLVVELYGTPVRIGGERLAAVVDANPHLHYHGPYAYPDGLAEVYAGADLAWCVDLADSPGNSDWLLPNRLYEALFFNVPAVAIAGTTTGDWVERHAAGLVIDGRGDDALAEAIDLLWADAEGLADRAADVPTSALVGSDDLGTVLRDLGRDRGPDRATVASTGGMA